MKYEQEDCGISRALEVIGGKWTILIVRDLLEGPKHFGQLEQSLAGISPRTLTLRLKELETEGVLERQCDMGHHPIYALTAKGESLHNLIDQMRSWGDARVTV